MKLSSFPASAPLPEQCMNGVWLGGSCNKQDAGKYCLGVGMATAGPDKSVAAVLVCSVRLLCLQGCHLFAIELLSIIYGI